MTPRKPLDRMIRTVATLAAMAALIIPPAVTASAAVPPCRVTNLTTKAVYTGTGANLQTAIDAASSGVSLRINGTCVGTFNTDSKDLTLIGATSSAYPKRATLDGGLAGTVLTVTAGTVSVRNLRLMRGLDGGIAGGIITHGTLRLLGSTIVTLNRGAAAVANDGDLAMYGHSSISGNKTTGVTNSGGTFTMNDSSTIADNIVGKGPGGTGGGVFNTNLGTSFVMNDSSSITGNQAVYNGGGIANGADVTMNDASTISRNTAGVRGGGVWNPGSGTLNGVVDGGNVFSNTPDNVYPPQT